MNLKIGPNKPYQWLACVAPVDGRSYVTIRNEFNCIGYEFPCHVKLGF